MRDVLLSNCEKKFILNAAKEKTRLDGRSFEEWRSLKICLGSEWGSCHVSLGNTKVVSNISCKVGIPKQTRPNEGILYVNVELGTMGSPNFESNRQSDLNVYLNRLIEKCLKESKCVDLESLCVVSEEKVWVLRIDIHVLNHAGNLIECASIAALTSLAHFKRPDITTTGEDIIIHTLAEKDPIPIVLHHYPVCVSFGIFSDGSMIADPNLIEETVCFNSGAIFVVGMNPYREVCLFDLAGVTVIHSSDIVYRGTQRAVERVQYVVKEIKAALGRDADLRANDKCVGFAEAIPKNELMTLAVDKLFLRLNKFDFNMDTDVNMKDDTKTKLRQSSDEMSDDENAGGVTALVSKEGDKKEVWPTMQTPDSGAQKNGKHTNVDDDVEIIDVITQDKRIVAKINVSSDSEEENVIVLNYESVGKSSGKSKKKKG